MEGEGWRGKERKEGKSDCLLGIVPMKYMKYVYINKSFKKVYLNKKIYISNFSTSSNYFIFLLI